MNANKHLKQIDRVLIRKKELNAKLRGILTAALNEFVDEQATAGKGHILLPQSALTGAGLDSTEIDGWTCNIIGVCRDGFIAENRCTLKTETYPFEKAEKSILIKLFVAAAGTDEYFKEAFLFRKEQDGFVYYCNRDMESDAPATTKSVMDKLAGLIMKHGNRYGKDRYELHTFDFCSDEGVCLEGSTVDKITWDGDRMRFYYNENTGDYDELTAFRPAALKDFHDRLEKYFENPEK